MTISYLKYVEQISSSFKNFFHFAYIKTKFAVQTIINCLVKEKEVMWKVPVIKSKQPFLFRIENRTSKLCIFPKLENVFILKCFWPALDGIPVTVLSVSFYGRFMWKGEETFHFIEL